MPDEIIQYLHGHMAVFGGLDYLVFAINLLLFIFSRRIVAGFGKGEEDPGFATRLWTLRFLNIVLVLLYVSALLLNDWAKQISKTGLTLLVSYLALHFLRALILRRYGREREIDGESRHTETYQSEAFALLALVLTVIVALLVMINIWGMTDWLKATSVLGGLLIILFSTKDVWAPDNINGLILLYNGEVEPGAVIRVDELGLLAYVMQTTLTQTVLRDLQSRHLIVVPNARLRNSRIDVLSRCPGSGLMRCIDFKLAYGLESARVGAFFDRVWRQACELESRINPDKPGVVRIQETGDHAVTWRFCYWLKNVYGLLEADFTIRQLAYDLARQEGIGLNTPLTHKVTLEGTVAGQEKGGASAG